LALVEARIDFSDEADVPEDLLSPALKIAGELQEELGAALAGADRGERLREGLVVAIAGPPNAGKSTLLNGIARREAAIVSPFAGTTRDVIEVHLDLDGYPVTVLDTAGIRESDDPVEQEGVRRARERASGADLVLWVQDAREPVPPPPTMSALMVWTIHNKVDLLPVAKKKSYEHEFAISKNEFILSALTKEGMNKLIGYISSYAAVAIGGEPSLITRQRHRSALESASAALDRALAEGPKGREDIIAEELRLAANTLGRLTGRVDPEDILDVIFRDFCIGK
jgi:tRNA modification GTPase